MRVLVSAEPCQRGGRGRLGPGFEVLAEWTLSANQRMVFTRQPWRTSELGDCRMATLVIVGDRDAALQAALAQEHGVFVVSERKPYKRRRDRLLGSAQVDLSETDEAA